MKSFKESLGVKTKSGEMGSVSEDDLEEARSLIESSDEEKDEKSDSDSQDEGRPSDYSS